MPDRKTVAVLGTFDTKGEELQYLAAQVKQNGCISLTMDVGVHYEGITSADISAGKVAEFAGDDIQAIRNAPRGEAVEKISQSAAAYLLHLVASGEVHAVVGVGGSGGTTICCSAMRQLPYGIPKLMVSTLASGNTRWHVDISDIMMMPSLLDIGGLNPMLEMVLRNAAGAICGMAKNQQAYTPSGKKVVSFTMYGTTTPGVSRARQEVQNAGFEPWTFHASGIGGRTMERLIRLGHIQAVVDMTLAEIGAHLVGGLHDAGPDRLEAAGAMGIPQVIVPGAADTIVLPPRNQVPEKFSQRTLNFHNPTMTTMRTNSEECKQIGEYISAKLNQAKGPVIVIIPRGGLSSIDRPGKIFHLPEANEALFKTLKTNLKPDIQIIEDDHHLDDPEFAVRVGRTIIDLLKG